MLDHRGLLQDLAIIVCLLDEYDDEAEHYKINQIWWKITCKASVKQHEWCANANAFVFCHLHNFTSNKKEISLNNCVESYKLIYQSIMQVWVKPANQSCWNYSVRDRLPISIIIMPLFKVTLILFLFYPITSNLYTERLGLICFLTGQCPALKRRSTILIERILFVKYTIFSFINY